jgi:acetoin:2,6-dichlorophenolindophenol oxidoreductase subunit alpha
MILDLRKRLFKTARKLSANTEGEMELTRDDYITLYRKMALTRKIEDRIMISVTERKIPFAMHMGRGQEAVGVGGATFLRKDDICTITHRGVAHAVAKGISTYKIFAELYCKKTGPTAGKGGATNLIDENIGLCGAYNSIGGYFVLAVGYGLAAQMKKDHSIVAVFFGEGASNRGTFHEGLNLASIWKLPIVWICENNEYAISAKASWFIPTPNVADRAAAYNMPGVVVDGNDVLAVHQAVQAAADRARSGLGPSMVEAKTYRIRPHCEGRREHYRTKEEVMEWEKKDPLDRYQNLLLDKEILTLEIVSQIEQENTKEVTEAEEAAAHDQAPDPSTALEGVYT